MRRSLAAAAIAVTALVQPASAGIDPVGIVRGLFEECMDCFPQVLCVNSPRPCPAVIDVPPAG
jgi:hypothetical protein